MIGRLRLWSGYLLFAYATTHLLNHMLGIVSVEAMEAGLRVFDAVWRNPIGTALLSAALALHVGLVLYALFRRRRLLMSRAEWAQLLLGLSILPLGLIHIVGTRGAYELYDVQTNYAWVLLATLASGWDSILRQLGLVIAVWVHGCIGLHRAWRLQAWYPPRRSWLLGMAVVWPTLALAGTIVGLRDFDAIRAQPDRLQPILETMHPPNRAETANLYFLADCLAVGFAGLVVLVLSARPLRTWWQRREGVTRLTYGGLPGGPREITTPVGTSILEISRSAGIPHASVCGGRGRCSTCRVRIGGADRARLPPPSEAEKRVLDRIDAPAGVRLACQLRPPAGSYHVVPLLPVTAAPAEAYRPAADAHGNEHVICVLFCDLRGFTSLSEGRLPFDVVFILNRYFRAVGQSVADAGGRLDKFIGDGAMALFGAEPLRVQRAPPRDAARRALDAARRIAIAVDELNRSLSGDLEVPLRLGIGVHAGPAIVGEMGYGRNVSLTAIGDTVNIASRLESASKELGCELVVSEALLTLAEATLEGAPQHLLEVRGRQGRLEVRAVADAAQIVITAT